MLAARYKGMVVGIVLGGVSVFLTCHLGYLFHANANLIMRALKTAGVALIVPGLIAGIAVGNVHTFRLWIVGVVNFLFWFGFGSLFGIFVEKLFKLRQAIAAARVPSTGVSGPLSAGQSDRSSSLGPG